MPWEVKENEIWQRVVPPEQVEEILGRKRLTSEPHRIDALVGRLKSGKTALVSLRFPKDEWTLQEAKKWFEKHKESFKGNSSGMRANAYDLPDGGQRPPEWIQLARVGIWLGHPQKPYVITPEHINSMADHFQRHWQANGKLLVVDYQHESLKYTKGAGAAAWIDRMEVREGATELWAHINQWDPEAAELVSRRRYRYVSPVYVFGAKDRLTGEKVPAYVLNVALTNTPFMLELPALVNSLGTELPGLFSEEDEVMDILEMLAKGWGASRDEVACSLGVKPDASAEDVSKAVQAKLSAQPQVVERLPEAVANSLGVAEDAGPEDVKAAIIRLEAKAADMQVVANALGLDEKADTAAVLAEIGKLKNERTEHEAVQIVENAIREGRITPAQKDWWIDQAKKDFDATCKAIEKMPVIIPNTAASSAPAGQPPAPQKGMSQDEKVVCSLMGISEEDYVKYGKGA